MSILVTGGTGFVGSSVCKHLARAGEDVVTYDVVPGRGLQDLLLTAEQKGRVKNETGDLLDLPRMLRVGRDHGVDRIVHLAYVVTLPTRRNPTYAQRANIDGTNHVFELALQRSAKLVMASTIDVFGPRSIDSNGNVANDAVYDPEGIYGASKLLNEVAARDYATGFGLDALTLRIPAAFGPGITQSWVRFVPQMIKALVEGRPAPAPTTKDVMPWLYVEDIAEAFAKALTVTGDPKVRGYTLPGTKLGVDKIVELILSQFPGSAPEWIDWPRPASMPSFDGSAAQKLLNWSPRYGIESGLSRIADFYRGALTGQVPN